MCSQINIAAGLSVALQDKAKAEEKIRTVERQLAMVKKAHAVSVQRDAATLSTCKSQVA